MCPIREPLNEIHKSILGVLRNVSLADIFRPPANSSTFQPVLSILNHRPAVESAVLSEVTA
jgi:hypothetical protein